MPGGIEFVFQKRSQIIGTDGTDPVPRFPACADGDIPSFPRTISAGYARTANGGACPLFALDQVLLFQCFEYTERCHGRDLILSGKFIPCKEKLLHNIHISKRCY